MEIIQQIRGTTAQNDPFIGPAGLLTVDTNRWELRLHDGIKPGGHRILNLVQLRDIFISRDSEFGNVDFDPADRGFLVRIAHRSYALRKFIEGQGIQITEPMGQNDDTTIAIHPDVYDMLGMAHRLLLIDTEGTSDAFTATLPYRWAETPGAVFLARFHIAANADAELQLTIENDPADEEAPEPTPLTARPIRLYDGTTRLEGIIREGCIGLVVVTEDSYVVTGLQHPQTQGILPIAGLVADNVQDALEELLSKIPAAGGGGAPALSEFRTYSNWTSISTTITHSNIGLTADGQSRAIHGYFIAPADSQMGVGARWGASKFIFVRIGNVYHYAQITVQWGARASDFTNPPSTWGPVRLPTQLTRLGTTFSLNLRNIQYPRDDRPLAEPGRIANAFRSGLGVVVAGS